MELSLLFEWAARATLPLALALLIARIAIQRSAAQRHWLYLSALITAALLPLAAGLAPSIEVPLLDPAPPPSVAPVGYEEVAVTPAASALPVVSEYPAPTPAAPLLTIESVLLFVWVAGIALLLARRIAQHRRLARFATSARPFHDTAWTGLVERTSAQLGLRTPVHLLLHPDAATPATWGVRRPVVLLPTEALAWPSGRRRAVLMHELGHVRRRDVFTQQVADAICVLLWFHPLVWSLAQRMRVEREKACDDLVLAAGARPSGYASALLDMYRRLDAARFPSHSAAACGLPRSAAGAEGIERRLTHVLDPMQSHDRLPLWKAAATALCVSLLALPAAGLQVTQRDKPAQDSKRTTGADKARPRTDRAKPTQRAKPEDVEKRLKELLEKHKTKGLAPADLEKELRRLVEGTEHGSDGVSAAGKTKGTKSDKAKDTKSDAKTKKVSDSDSKRSSSSDSSSSTSRSSDSSGSGSSSSSSSTSGGSKQGPAGKRVIVSEKTLVWTGRGLPSSKEIDNLTRGMPAELRTQLKGLVGDMRRESIPELPGGKLKRSDKRPPELERQTGDIVKKKLKELGVDPQDVRVKRKTKVITADKAKKEKPV